jgi:hypothetical protein
LEGSVVFFLIAFLVVHLPILLMTDIPRGHCVVAALLIAMIVTLFEAVSLSGADNLFVPIGACVGLQKALAVPFAETVFQLASFLVIFLYVGIITHKGNWFSTGGKLLLALAAYGFWALGGWLSALPYLIALGLSLPLALYFQPSGREEIKVRYLAGMSLPPFLFVAIGNSFEATHFYYGPTLAAFATTTTLWFHEERRWLNRPVSTKVNLVLLVAGWLLIVVTPWLFLVNPSLELLLWQAVVIVAAVGIERLVTRYLSAEPGTVRWTARRFTAATMTGVAIVALQLWGGLDSWTPDDAPVNPRYLFWDGQWPQ